MGLFGIDGGTGWNVLWPIAGAGAGAALGGASGAQTGGILGGGVANVFGQQQTNAVNQQMMTQQEQFQAQMSDTAHQREVQDLRRAGLNPLLSANAGASTPSGSLVNTQNPFQGLPGAISNAVDARQKQQMNDSNVALNDETRKTTAANGALLSMKAVTEAANAREANQNAIQARLISDRMNAGQDAELKRAKIGPYIDMISKAVGAAANATEAGAAVGAAAKYLRQPPMKPGTGMLKDGTKLNLNTGEVLK